jgi:hypothetical protein
MKKQGRVHAKWDEKKWFESLDPKELIDILPVIKAPGGGARVYIPIYPSQEILADKMKESRPDLFKRRLDAYRSLLYAGAQIWEHVLKGTGNGKLGKSYEFHLACEEILAPSRYLDIIRSKIKELAESYGNGNLSQNVLSQKMGQLMEKVDKSYHQQFMDMWDDEFEDNDTIAKMKARLRKREERNRRRNIKIVGGE